MSIEKLWLSGKRVESSVTEPLKNPATGETIADICQATPEQIEAAIAAMVSSFPALRKRHAHERAKSCEMIVQGLTARVEDFAKAIAKESAKPIKAARGEVDRAITTFKLAAEEATRITGEQIPVDITAALSPYHAIVERFPIGPCSLIAPFNFPLNLVAHKVAPAIAAGCPFILKPSERTPITGLLLGELLAQANLPEGSWHVLPTDRVTARPLVTDDRIKLLSFTGSAEVGWKMKADAGKKTVVLELGGNCAVICEPETDKVFAVPRLIFGAFAYSGQTCIKVQRIYLHESIADRMTEMLISATEKLVVGDPMDDKTDICPLIDTANADRIQKWIADAGGEILCGNKREGNFIWPTLIKNPKPDSLLATQEAFGPITSIETYTDFDDALKRVNNTRFGLQAGVFTQDLRKIRRAFDHLDMGSVLINDIPTVRIENQPYGGVKDSGTGREGIKYAFEHMTERKTLITREVR